MILNYVRKNIETLAEQGIWHEIPDFQTIVNSTVSKSRGFSPFFLTFFRHANFPFTSLVTERPSLGEHNTMHARINFSQKILKQAEGVNAEMFKANKMSYDRRIRHSKIKTGDLVMVKTSQRGKIHRKIARQFKGPFVCVRLLPNNNLELKPLSGRKLLKTHVNLCKLLPHRFQLLRFNDLTSLPPFPPAPQKEEGQAPEAALLPADPGDDPEPEEQMSDDSSNPQSDQSDDSEIEEQELEVPEPNGNNAEPEELPNPPNAPPMPPARPPDPERGPQPPAYRHPPAPRGRGRPPGRGTSTRGTGARPKTTAGPAPVPPATTRAQARDQNIQLPGYEYDPLPLERRLNKALKGFKDKISPAKKKKSDESKLKKTTEFKPPKKK